MIVREYLESDLEKVKEIDMMFGLEVQWNRNFSKENVVVCMEDEKVVGAGALSFDPGWSYMEMDIEHKLHMDLYVLQSEVEKDQIYEKVMNGLLKRFNELKKEYPEKRLCICRWIPAVELENIQVHLKNGFFMRRVTPVLRFDLNKEIQHYQIPDDVKIERLVMEDANIDAYLKATGEAHDGVCDSKADFMFRSGADNFEVYAAKHDERIVGGITLWDFTPEESATEDIFTVPEFRRKNIAREMIAIGLDRLKEHGQKQATLSLLGENESAMRLYESIGYELLFLLIELNYR